MSETKEYSKTLCDERHQAHEKYEAMRFAQIEKEQSEMGDLIKDVNNTLKERFDRDGKLVVTILLAVLGVLGTQICNLIFK